MRFFCSGRFCVALQSLWVSVLRSNGFCAFLLRSNAFGCFFVALQGIWFLLLLFGLLVLVFSVKWIPVSGVIKVDDSFCVLKWVVCPDALV